MDFGHSDGKQSLLISWLIALKYEIRFPAVKLPHISISHLNYKLSEQNHFQHPSVYHSKAHLPQMTADLSTLVSTLAADIVLGKGMDTSFPGTVISPLYGLTLK